MSKEQVINHLLHPVLILGLCNVLDFIWMIYFERAGEQTQLMSASHESAVLFFSTMQLWQGGFNSNGYLEANVVASMTAYTVCSHCTFMSFKIPQLN